MVRKQTTKLVNIREKQIVNCENIVVVLFLFFVLFFKASKLVASAVRNQHPGYSLP